MRPIPAPSSLSALLLLLLLFYCSSVVGLQTAASDVAALAAFKAGIARASINQWSCLASWDFSSDPCRPARPAHFTCGLACSPDGTRVTAIVLDPAGYAGPLPPSLSNLTLLAQLDLSDNSFYGPIPSSLSSLSSLQTLVLSSNSFSGPIPPALSNLSSLETLDLSRNALTGTIPGALSSLRNLRTLDLSSNRIAGGLPGTLPPNLVELALRGNSLTGKLQRATFAPLRYLEVVELAANRFEGRLEGWFLLLPSLQQVDLANNSLQQLEVWGTATATGGGERLVALDLGFNRIEGELPVGLAAFPSLAALTLRYNRLRGAIPWEYYGAKKGVQFRRLFLDGNFLNGRAPQQFLGGGLSGSLGDNCLESCPSTAVLCSPVQKPNWVCKQVYGGDAGRRQRTRPPRPALGG